MPAPARYDLRSDTVTQPSDAMRAAMAAADVGDDVYGEDPTINQLEACVAERLGKDAGLFAPSGTQSNLIGLLTHCGRGDEYIVGQAAHTYRYEGGGAAVLGGIQPQPVSMAEDGHLPLDEVRAVIKPLDVHFARSKLLCLENTHAGVPLPLDYSASARKLCDETGLGLHLDGARLFNAATAYAQTPAELAEPFDTVSVCLSKGLGAPVGSVLVGSADFVNEARRWRKVLGGGMRQAGILAAAGLYAINHNIERLAVDHDHAALIAEQLRAIFGADKIRQRTNMIHLNLDEALYAELYQHMGKRGVNVARPRWVFHLGIDEAGVTAISEALTSFSPAA